MRIVLSLVILMLATSGVCGGWIFPIPPAYTYSPAPYVPPQPGLPVYPYPGDFTVSLNSQMSALLSASTPGFSQSIWTTCNPGYSHTSTNYGWAAWQGPDGSSYVRNPNFVFNTLSGATGGLAVTAIVPYCYGGGGDYYYHYTFISPIHCVGANHYTIGAGANLRVVDRNGVPFDTTIVASTSNNSDIAVFQVADDVTITRSVVGYTQSFVGIDYLPVLPVTMSSYFINYASYTTSVQYAVAPNVALVYFLGGGVGHGTAQLAFAGDTGNPGSFPDGSPFYIGNITNCLDIQRAAYAWWPLATSGDSGNPLCFAVNGQLVLNNCFTAPTGGYSYVLAHDAINQLMARLQNYCGTTNSYTLTDVNLSAFRKAQ